MNHSCVIPDKLTHLRSMPETAKFLAYPDTKATDMGLFTPDWKFIVPRRGPWLERYNQVFTS